MKERFELLEKAILTMVEDKKYATLRDILVTVNPACSIEEVRKRSLVMI